MSTLPDPRNQHKAAALDQTDTLPKHHPDLDDEVATLSTKLINAINYQTELDDTLSAARHELAAARERIRDLESQNTSLRETMSGDIWIRRSTLESEKKAMRAEQKALQAKLTHESTKRLETEKEKRIIEQELENLTAALFEEANKMVIAAKEEAQAQNEFLHRKIDQLKSQLVDSESLLKTQQEQLTELKSVMESMASEQDDQTYGTAPPSPAIGKLEHDNYDRAAASDHGSEPLSPSREFYAPCPPLNLQHLIQPVLRTDLTAYDDFINLARLSHNKKSPARVSSGSFGGFNVLATGLGGSTSSTHPSNASTTSLGTSSQPDKSTPQSPETQASTANVNSPIAGGSIPPLKDTRFYKRALVEDIEPTLRLDLAPGLSWLARRTVLNSIADGSLIVEPIPASATYISIVKPQMQPCSLCGESRKESQYLRNHRFRTSESDSAQRYPLCTYCLHRVRSACDYLGFLRMVKDGYWRADDEDQEKAAWEESVRLRDQLFWARIGGGVVPISPGVAASASEGEADRDTRSSQESEETSSVTPSNDEHGTLSQQDAKTVELRAPPERETSQAVRITVQSADSQDSAITTSTIQQSVDS